MREKKFDLHVHTNCSDGINSPEEVLRYAKSIGLDGIAITDHDTVKGSKRVRKLAKELGIILIPGVEITTPYGDILALGVDEVFSGSPSEIIEKIRKAGGVSILAHPYGGFWRKSFAEMKTVKEFDAIEVFNAVTNDNFGIEANIKAMELAKKLKKPGTAGSDAHTLDMVGTAVTKAKGDIIEAIKKGTAKIEWL
jgi:predicted metal-dependent phosphoesterase TrpH